MAQADFKYLTPEMRELFLKHGYVKIPGAIPKEKVDAFTSNVFVRLGWDENDKSTWVEETVHLPRHREEPTKEHMPEAYHVACELVGGEDKFDDDIMTKSGDSLILNFGSDFWTGHEQHPRDTGNWHVDGDWFDRFLDSTEQALVTICLYTDVVHDGGPTYICPNALPKVIRWLYEHPEGGWDNKEHFPPLLEKEEEFVELTGNAGDVFLCHPFMPHSKSRNHLRKFRAITNPCCSLREPLNFNRSDGNYTMVEQKILQDIGKESLPDWHITRERRRFQPRTQPSKTAKIKEELARMQAHAAKTGIPVDSLHLRGETMEVDKLMRYPALHAPIQPGKVDSIERARPRAIAV